MTAPQRLTHSDAGYLRQMQMSRHDLWVFVEGLADRALFSHVCDDVCAEKTKGIVVMAQELPGNEGGKARLLEYHAYLRDESCLVSELEGKRAVAVFFVDKDIDDICVRCSKCEHLVYSEYYSVENYLFCYGDLRRALTDAALLDQESVNGVIPETGMQWTERIAPLWKEWVCHCVFVQKHGLRTQGYALDNSPIHCKQTAAENEAEKTKLKEHAYRLSGLSEKEFESEYATCATLVEEFYSTAKCNYVFRGSWYKYFVAQEARKAAGIRSFAVNGLGDRVVSILMTTIDSSGAWATRYRTCLTHALTSLGVITSST